MYKFLDQIKDYVFGGNGGIRYSDLNTNSFRNKFSEYLPYQIYDDELEAYLNKDETVGFCWENAPLCFAGKDTTDTLESLLSIDFPAKTVMQFILYADDHIEPYLAGHFNTKDEKRMTPLVKGIAEDYAKFLSQGTKGLDKLSGIPVRNFRSIVTLKIPFEKEMKSKKLEQLKQEVSECLFGASLHPENMPPGPLLGMLRRLFNEKYSADANHYDDELPLNKQIILSDSKARKRSSSIKFGNRKFKILTPKIFQHEINLMKTNILAGGINGFRDDRNQITTPFIYNNNFDS